MPNRRVVLLTVVLLGGTPLASALNPDPVDWYVESLCPDDGIACTVEEAFYGQCRHRIDPEACLSNGEVCSGERYCDPARGGCVCRETALVTPPD